MNHKSFYITTPIFYPNATPHMGHAYTTLLSDVLARYHRSIGVETYFLTGTDEHTEKVIQAAAAQQQDPHEYLETIVERFKSLYARLNISYDQFIRTSDQVIHWPGVVEMWNRLEKAGDIYKSQYVGLYCVGCEAFLTEKDLVDGKCPDHGKAPEKVAEDNYFFRLSKYASQIERLIVSDSIRVVPASRKNEILSLIESGLDDVSFSRPKEKMSWGIPVPGDETQTMYIWMDALTNYITALGFGRGEENMRLWPGVHVIGKDILRFHAAFWPAMLLSAQLPLPKAILVHGMITSGGRKMSKTLGNIIDPSALIDEYGADAVRYYLARHVSPFEDGDLTHEHFKEAYNGNLSNGLGNQVARIMKLAQEHLDKPVDLPQEALVLQPAFKEFMEAFKVNDATALIWEHVAKADSYIQETQPFKLVKSEDPADRARAKGILSDLVVHLVRIATHLAPIMPETSEKILAAVKENTMPPSLFPRKE